MWDFCGLNEESYENKAGMCVCACLCLIDDQMFAGLLVFFFLGVRSFLIVWIIGVMSLILRYSAVIAIAIVSNRVRDKVM